MDYELLEDIITNKKLSNTNKIKKVEKFIIDSCESGNWILYYDEANRPSRITKFFMDNVGRFKLRDSDNKKIECIFYPHLMQLECDYPTI